MNIKGMAKRKVAKRSEKERGEVKPEIAIDRNEEYAGGGSNSDVEIDRCTRGEVIKKSAGARTGYFSTVDTSTRQEPRGVNSGLLS